MAFSDNSFSGPKCRAPEGQVATQAGSFPRVDQLHAQIALLHLSVGAELGHAKGADHQAEMTAEAFLPIHHHDPVFGPLPDRPCGACRLARRIPAVHDRRGRRSGSSPRGTDRSRHQTTLLHLTPSSTWCKALQATSQAWHWTHLSGSKSKPYCCFTIIDTSHVLHGAFSLRCSRGSLRARRRSVPFRPCAPGPASDSTWPSPADRRPWRCRHVHVVRIRAAIQ